MIDIIIKGNQFLRELTLYSRKELKSKIHGFFSLLSCCVVVVYSSLQACCLEAKVS
jgi:hypothetical protein